MKYYNKGGCPQRNGVEGGFGGIKRKYSGVFQAKDGKVLGQKYFVRQSRTT